MFYYSRDLRDIKLATARKGPGSRLTPRKKLVLTTNELTWRWNLESGPETLIFGIYRGCEDWRRAWRMTIVGLMLKITEMIVIEIIAGMMMTLEIHEEVKLK